MKDVVALSLLFPASCVLFVLANAVLPFPDGLLFTLWIAGSASFLAVAICVALGNEQIDRAGDLMRRINAGRPRHLYWAAHLLGTAVVATTLVVLHTVMLRGR
jgi:hypothetical protein